MPTIIISNRYVYLAIWDWKDKNNWIFRVRRVFDSLCFGIGPITFEIRR